MVVCFSLQFQFSAHYCGKSRQRLKLLVLAHQHKVKSREKCKHAHLFDFTQLDFSILRQFRTSCLGNDGVHSGLDLPTSICLNNTTFHRHGQRPTQCRQFLNENSLPGDSSMHQTNKANHHTPFSSVWHQFHGKVEPSI